MTSLSKKIQKSKEPTKNAVVLGTAFDNLSDILEIFENVFVFSDQQPIIKKKNLVYRSTFDSLDTINEITHVFVDLNRVDDVPKIYSLLTRFHVNVLVEGEDLIERPQANVLWNIHYIPIETFKSHHLWIKKQ
jgi:hypothetical protein